jgi:hypothetical protein
MRVDIGSGLFWGWGWLAAVGVIIILGIFLLPWFFFLLNLQNLLEHVSPANRRMTPGLVWLNFIPIFHLGWFIYTVIKVKDSVNAEFQSRGWMVDGDLGYNVGLTSGILWIAAFFIGWIPFIGWILPLAGVVCWIIYWLKTSDLKHRLEGPPPWVRPAAYPAAYPPTFPSAVAPPYAAGYPQPYAPPAAPVEPVPPPPSASTEPSGDEPTAETQETRCGACGSKLDPGDRFCRSCGLPLP